MATVCGTIEERKTQVETGCRVASSSASRWTRWWQRPLDGVVRTSIEIRHLETSRPSLSLIGSLIKSIENHLIELNSVKFNDKVTRYDREQIDKFLLKKSKNSFKWKCRKIHWIISAGDYPSGDRMNETGDDWNFIFIFFKKIFCRCNWSAREMRDWRLAIDHLADNPMIGRTEPIQWPSDYFVQFHWFFSELYLIYSNFIAQHKVLALNN